MAKATRRDVPPPPKKQEYELTLTLNRREAEVLLAVCMCASMGTDGEETSGSKALGEIHEALNDCGVTWTDGRCDGWFTLKEFE